MQRPPTTFCAVSIAAILATIATVGISKPLQGSNVHVSVNPEPRTAPEWSWIMADLDKEQMTETTQYIPFIQDEQFSGLFKSHVAVNFVGDAAPLRHAFSVLDNNYFVTNWVCTTLLGIIDLAPSREDPALQRRLLSLLRPAISALTSPNHFHDANFEATDPTLIFWKQKLNANGTHHAWPSNLVEPMQLAFQWKDAIRAVLLELGLDELWEVLDRMYKRVEDFSRAFGIPADLDDSSVNMVLGYTLQRLLEGSTTPPPGIDALWKKWQSAPYNTDPRGLFQIVSKYAYRPFSSNNDVNLVDPRSYYWLRGFLASRLARDEKRRSRHGLAVRGVALATTWISDRSRSERYFHDGYKMPFNVNNIDLAVCANAVLGMASTAFLTAAPIPSDAAQVLVDTTELLAYALRSGMLENRRDLVLVYYPSIHEALWFMARIVGMLRDELGQRPAGFPSLQRALATLEPVMRSHGTKMLLRLGHRVPNTNFYVWDDFLGHADHPTEQVDDRLFCTAVSAHALIELWTAHTCRKKDSSMLSGFSTDCGFLEWRTETPASVRAAVAGARAFLVARPDLRRDNVFFSGSFKTASTLLWQYPSNFVKYLNGSEIPWEHAHMRHVRSDLLVAVRGVIDEGQYQAMIQRRPFGMNTTLEFDEGFNRMEFPFWRSDAMTLSVTLATIVKAAAIVD